MLLNNGYILHINKQGLVCQPWYPHPSNKNAFQFLSYGGVGRFICWSLSEFDMLSAVFLNTIVVGKKTKTVQLFASKLRRRC